MIVRRSCAIGPTVLGGAIISSHNYNNNNSVRSKLLLSLPRSRNLSSFRDRISALSESITSIHPLAKVLVQTLKSFGIGATLLVKDGYALWKRGLRSSELTFSDAVFSSSVRWDLMVGVPLTLWYLVPVVGNSVLILAYLFPPILPLCWRSPYLRAKLLKESEARALGAIVPSPLHPDFVSTLFPRYFAWPSRLAPSWLKERLVVWHWSVIKYQDSFLRNLNVMDVPHDVLELWAEMRAIPVVGETDISTVPHDLPKNGRGVPLIPGKEREDALRQQLIAWQKRSSALPSALDTEKYCISMHTAHHQ